MSVHDKKTVPEHIHFEDEVVAARNVRAGRPAYKNVHGTDVVIDGSVTLNETIIAWSRGWIAEQFVDVDANCILEDDETASHGKALKLPSDVGNILEPFNTPTIEGEIAGEIYALFALKVNSIASSSQLCILRVRASGVTRGYYVLKPSDFPAVNTWHHFAVRGMFKGNDTDRHIDIYDFKSISGAHLHVDYIGIVPTSVPLAYSTIGGHSRLRLGGKVGTIVLSTGTGTDLFVEQAGKIKTKVIALRRYSDDFLHHERDLFLDNTFNLHNAFFDNDIVFSDNSGIFPFLAGF